MPKVHPIDITVREYHALQENLAGNRTVRRTQIILISAVLALLCTFGILLYLLPHETVSEEENRPLQTLPALSSESLLSGAFSSDISAFYADQFPTRSIFVGLKALSELVLQKQENNGVLIGREGYLIDRLEYGDAEYRNLAENLSAAQEFAMLARDAGIPCTFAVAPRTVDVTHSYFPALYVDTRAAVICEIIAERAPEAVDLAAMLRSLSQDTPVMYKTDHHWTTLGAYCAYEALGSVLGYEPYPRSDFTEEISSTAFLGTTYSASGIKWAEPDRISLWRYDGDGSFSVLIHDTGEMRDVLYDRSFLETKDKYSVFLGGNYGHVSIRKTENVEADRKTLLLIKDSFALSLVPFLARHYDIEMIDPRYFCGSAVAFLDGIKNETENGGTVIDSVFILCGADTLAQSAVLPRLLYGVK